MVDAAGLPISGIGKGNGIKAIETPNLRICPRVRMLCPKADRVTRRRQEVIFAVKFAGTEAGLQSAKMGTSSFCCNFFLRQGRMEMIHAWKRSR
jgi:hypothetical protein